MAGRRSDRWDAHPVLAWWVRVAVVLVPLLASVLVALLLVALLPHPTTVLARTGWWTLVLGAALLAAHVVERLARRALPLAVLLTLSLVFPDRAPSRLRAARATSLREIERQVAALQDVDEPAEAARTLVALVGALGLHDKRTRGHSERVRAYVDLITEELGLPEADRVRLRWAALLHDIGKLTVPGAVLNGGRDLDEPDWHALRLHPDEGERLAAALLPWLGEWGRCVREHHERWDGHGYPQGLAGTAISQGARIVAVADAYEVMTANRSYQRAISPAAARAELSRCAGTDFDPSMVRAFLQVSIGRLRWVLGPVAFLPVLPLLGHRVGDALKGATNVAAATAVGLTLAAAPTALPTPRQHPVTLGAGTPVVLPTPSVTPSPTPRAVPPTVAPAPAVRRATPTRSPAPAAPPVVPTPTPTPAPPAGLARLLYLGAAGGLSARVSGTGAVVLQPGGSGAVFSAPVPGTTTLQGTPVATLVVTLQTRHGRGHPPSSLTGTLQDCAGSTCRALSTGTAAVPQRAGTLTLTVTMSAVDAVVRAGDVLRLELWAQGSTDVASVSVAYGGSSPSTLRLA